VETLTHEKMTSAGSGAGTRLSACVACPHRETGFCESAFRLAAPALQMNEGGPKFLTIAPGKQIFAQGGSPDHIFVLCSGWAFRYIQLSNGNRQINKFLMSGDLFSSISIFEEVTHFSARALTSVQICMFPRSAFRDKCFTDNEFQSAMARSFVADARDTAELAAVLGRRSAEQRIAYLFLHLIQRIAVNHVIREGRYPFPLRQQHIADAVGLTPVHVSRVLSTFRERGIIWFSDGVLEILDFPELERMGSL
jgi:CRP/FNR family transcriptional regulator, anaerobic regulatory protein